MSDVIERAIMALNGVTPSPWNCHDFGVVGMDEPSCTIVYAGEKFDWQAVRDGDFLFATNAWDSQQYLDANFVAAARTLVPELIAKVAELKAEIAWMVDHQ